MSKDIFRNFLEGKEKLKFIRKNTIGKYKKYYFDYTASGLAFKPIEQRINEVLKTYANTHSPQSSNADLTTKYYEKARENLAKSLDISKDFVILPCGYGSTGAIKKCQELLGLYLPPATKERYDIKVDKTLLPLVVIGPYEHHSNEVSFKEALCEVRRINLNDKGFIDLEELRQVLKENKHRKIISSFSLASNVTGIKTPYKKISKLLRDFGAIVCFDGAASSAYENVSSKYYDALFLSPHKLLGGVGSCGILVMKRDLIDTSLSPTFSAGGTVKYVNKDYHTFKSEIEEREDAGTPGILQFIKASLAYQLRNEIGFKFIKKRKDKLRKIFLNEIKTIKNCKIYGSDEKPTLAIVSLNIKNLNPYKLCAKLSKISNFQTRAGCSCAGSYGHDLLNITKIDEKSKPGWLRISLHFSHTKKEVLHLAKTIKDIAKENL